MACFSICKDISRNVLQRTVCFKIPTGVNVKSESCPAQAFCGEYPPHSVFPTSAFLLYGNCPFPTPSDSGDAVIQVTLLSLPLRWPTSVIPSLDTSCKHMTQAKLTRVYFRSWHETEREVVLSPLQSILVINLLYRWYKPRVPEPIFTIM